MENILDILMDYTKKGKKIDNNYILKVISILVKKEQLEYFINNIHFDSSSTNFIVENAVMSYNFINKTIRINQKEIDSIYQSERYNEKYKCLHLLADNLDVTKCILHEIEHAIQFRNAIFGEANFENKLLGICFAYFIEVTNQNDLLRFINKLENTKKLEIRAKLYRTNYNFRPEERLANYRSALNILKILEPICKEIPDYTINSYKQYANDVLIRGYDLDDDIFSPTERFLKQFEQSGYPNTTKYLNDDFYALLDKMQYKDLKTKLELGVNVSKKVYKKVKNGFILP